MQKAVVSYTLVCVKASKVKEIMNTKYHRTKIKFSSSKGKKVEASFSGGDITSNAGLLLLREVDKSMKLTTKISNCILDKRHPGYTKHNYKTLLAQRVFAIANGDEDVNDQDSLRKDLCFQTCLDQDSVLGSSSTISRFEKRILEWDGSANEIPTKDNKYIFIYINIYG